MCSDLKFSAKWQITFSALLMGIRLGTEPQGPQRGPRSKYVLHALAVEVGGLEGDVFEF